MTVDSGLGDRRGPRRIGASARTLGATVARLDAATLAIERLSRAMPLRALHDAMRSLIDVPLDLSMLAATLDRTSAHAPIPGVDSLPTNAWRPGNASAAGTSGLRSWRTSGVRTPGTPAPGRTTAEPARHAPFAPTALTGRGRLPMDQPAKPEHHVAAETRNVQSPTTLANLTDSATRSPSHERTAAHPPSRSARAGFENSAHVPNSSTDGFARPAIPTNRPLQTQAKPPLAMVRHSAEPSHSSRHTPELPGTTVVTPARTATAEHHQIAASPETAPLGALGELIRRVDQMSADPPGAGQQAHSAPQPTPATDDSLDALEEALEVLIRRDAERHGIAGWSP